MSSEHMLLNSLRAPFIIFITIFLFLFLVRCFNNFFFVYLALLRAAITEAQFSIFYSSEPFNGFIIVIFWFNIVVVVNIILPIKP